MKKLLNPKWLILINTLPIVIMLILGWSEFSIIKTLLSDESIMLWKNFSITIIALATATLIYAVVQTFRKKYIDIAYSVITLVVYTLYAYIYYSYLGDMLPFSIPSWMVSGNIHLYVGACIMPTLLHAVFTLVVRLTPIAAKQKAKKSFAAAIAIPFFYYFFGVLIFPICNGVVDISVHFVTLGIIVGIIIFIAFMIRGFYIVMSKKDAHSKYAPFLKVLFSFVFPLIGLILNNTGFVNAFGDFSNFWFYGVAVINAIFICMPSNGSRTYRLCLFIGRSITFTFTLYFFIVFLPFLPLSVAMILLVGIGILMLTPLVLFIIHVNELFNDFKYLSKTIRPIFLHLIGIVCFTILPISLIASYVDDRKKLHTTLDYIYSPNYSQEYKLDKESVERTLESVDEKGRSDNAIFYASTPYLSNIYRWIVLDNLNLSEGKKERIMNIFNPKTEIVVERIGEDINSKNSIAIEDIKLESTYDEEKEAWVSWVHLTIKNEREQLWNAEYRTEFKLSAGCWISDYYLDVEGVRKKGILAEKKSATWIFNQIRRVNRDPGLLRYMGGNTIEFKVFPFQMEETRYTGIEFIHKDPVDITIDGHVLTLGDIEKHPLVDKGIRTDEMNGVVYISAEEKKRLPAVERQPYYHFIVDVSANKVIDVDLSYDERKEIIAQKKDFSKYVKQINDLLYANLISRDYAKISYTNTYVDTRTKMSSDWDIELKSKKAEGGFFLDRAIKKILYEHFINSSNTYPIIVVVSDDIEHAIFLDDMADYQFTYPEGNAFYHLTGDKLSSYYMFARKLHKKDDNVKEFIPREVVAYPSTYSPQVYLPGDLQASVAINPFANVWKAEDDLLEKNWMSGLKVQGQWMYQTLHPEVAKDSWLDLVRNSFASRIMTPLTSYIVLETEAQEALLMKKQAQVLSGNKNLDLADNDEVVRMSEPELYILLAFLGILYWFARKRKVRIK